MRADVRRPLVALESPQHLPSRSEDLHGFDSNQLRIAFQVRCDMWVRDKRPACALTSIALCRYAGFGRR
jgi:hypothetical protein